MTMLDFDLIIEPNKNINKYWKEIWKYRELLYFLAWRDFLVRYKQTVIGIAWALLRPLLTMIVFTIVFGKIAKLPSNGIPYALLVFSAMLPWQFFASALSESSSSLISNASMISKIYFPRLVIPVSTIFVCLVDFALSFSILVLLMLWYQYIPPLSIFLLPIFLGIALFCSLGFGLWLSALNVKYRDFRYVIPFIVQFGLYISPVGFKSDIVPENWKFIYSLNPMVGVIEGFRWSILGTNNNFLWTELILSVTISLIIFISGLWYFRKFERSFADVI